jgi:hypothetical protein
MYSLLPSAALAITASFWDALIGLSPPAPTEAPSAVAVGSLRVVFAIWAVAASTDMMMVGLGGGCPGGRPVGLPVNGASEWCLSRPPCGGNGIGESWLGSYVPKILLSVMVRVVVIELTVVDDERWAGNNE